MRSLPGGWRGQVRLVVLVSLAVSGAACGPRYVVLDPRGVGFLDGTWRTPHERGMQEELVVQGERIQFLVGQPPGPFFPKAFTKAYYDGRVLVFTDGRALATALMHFQVNGTDYLLEMSRLPPGELAVTVQLLERQGLRRVFDKGGNEALRVPSR